MGFPSPFYPLFLKGRKCSTTPSQKLSRITNVNYVLKHIFESLELLKGHYEWFYFICFCGFENNFFFPYFHPNCKNTSLLENNSFVVFRTLLRGLWPENTSQWKSVKLFPWISVKILEITFIYFEGIFPMYSKY